MENDAIGYVCGRCLVVREAHHHPDLCFRCGARFDRGAPLAMIHLDVGANALALDILPSIRWHGAWSATAQDVVADAVDRMFDAQEHGTGGPVACR